MVSIRSFCSTRSCNAEIYGLCGSGSDGKHPQKSEDFALSAKKIWVWAGFIDPSTDEVDASHLDVFEYQVKPPSGDSRLDGL